MYGFDGSEKKVARRTFGLQELVCNEGVEIYRI
jgi:hypothetical protein